MKTSKHDKIKLHLFNEDITSIEALEYYDHFRLASVIHRLRNRYFITTDLIEIDKDQTYARYNMKRFNSIDEIPEGAKVQVVKGWIVDPIPESRDFIKKDGILVNTKSGLEGYFTKEFKAVKLV